jgi:dTDP-4-amino-4,6-dideoxygalactose transaminase
MKITFNKPFLTGKETLYIKDAVDSGHISGNGKYTKLCQRYFEKKYGFNKTLLTTSCTDALEMCALLLNIQAGDEVIVPSYTFVSTALAFVRQGAKIVFADSRKDHPGIDEYKIEPLITEKTKAIIVVHYAGFATDMDKIMQLSEKYNISVVEDAAQAIDNYYKGRPLGSIGHLATFSFHETKNIQCGEGGLLIINDRRFERRAEIIWEKGTNRAEFFRGEINKYGWVDIGSSFLPSELNAAFLFAQLEHMNEIQKKRKSIWELYHSYLKVLEEKGHIKLPIIPDYSGNNAHMFYLICNSGKERKTLLEFLKNKGIYAVFHYLSLHKSEYYKSKHDGRELPMADYYTDTLLRLPFYYELSKEEVMEVITNIFDYFGEQY